MLKSAFGAALLALSVQTPVFAQDAPQRVLVVHDDLDLTNTADVRVLDRRLAAAVAATCPDPRDAGLQLTAHSCRVRARAQLKPVRARILAAAADRRLPDHAPRQAAARIWE